MKITDFANKKKYFIIIFLVYIVSILPVFNILNFHLDYDGICHLTMAQGIKDNLLNFNFRPYINERFYNGLGGVDPIIYPYLHKYVLVFFLLIFKNINIAFNLFVLVVQTLNVFIMYKSAFVITKNEFSSTISTIFWQLYMYRLYDIYSIEAIGEYVSLAFYPLVISGFYNILFDDKKSWYYFILGLILIAQNHIVTIFYTCILLLVFCIIFSYKIIRDKNILLILFKCFIILILISLYFYVPFIQYYLEKTVFATTKGNEFYDVSLKLSDIFFPINPLNFGESRNRLGFEVIPAYLIILIMSIIIIIKFITKKITSKENKIFNITFLVLVLLAVYHLLAYFKFFYIDIFMKNSFLQNIFNKQEFSYRELGRGGVYLAFSLGISLTNIKISRKISILLLIICLFSTSLPYLLINTFDKCSISENDVSDNNDFMPIEIDVNSKEYLLIQSLKSNLVQIDNIILKKTGIGEYQFNNKTLNKIKKDFYIEIPLYYYNGYIAIDDNKNKLEIFKNDNLKLCVILPNYETNIKVFFDPPILWKISNFISFICSITFIIYIFNILWKNHNKNIC